MNKVIVITGSTRGIGYGLAKSFLANKCKVVISGRQMDMVISTVKNLGLSYDPSSVVGFACDVTDETQLQNLWRKAARHFGTVDIWINNAGIAQKLKETWVLSTEEIDQIVKTNILGTIYGSRIAIQGMLAQKFGALYNMEGFGSTGSKMKDLTVYGMTKYAINYLNRSLIKETQSSNLIVGIIRPGMVATDLIKNQYTGLDKEFERAKPILNILSQRVDTISPILARALLKNKRTGKVIHGATPYSLLFRFLTAPLIKRNVYDE